MNHHSDSGKINQAARKLGLSLAAALAASLGAGAAAAQSIEDITLNVYKEITCGCCVGWIEHMDEHGYASAAQHPADITRVKLDLGIARQYHSCHTAVTDSGYLFEGHIPEKYIARFLADPPENAIGLSVPGMPIGGPGMEIGDRFTPYQILLLFEDGSARVFAEINSKADQ